MKDDDFNWLIEHGPELYRDYVGKWIAVRNGEVIGIGDTAPEAAAKAHANVLDGDFILEAIESDGRRNL